VEICADKGMLTEEATFATHGMLTEEAKKFLGKDVFATVSAEEHSVTGALRNVWLLWWELNG